jgi:restriction system protein
VQIVGGNNGIDLVELVLKYYGTRSEKYERTIPLKIVYVPAAKGDTEA